MMFDGLLDVGGLTVSNLGDTYVAATRGNHILKLPPIAGN
jgi:hypothetical protein